MKQILETNRLLLREMNLSDAGELYALNLDPDVIRYTGDPPFDSVEQATIFLKNYSDYARNGYGRWAVLLKPELEFIGWCGLKLNEHHDVDLGFRFFKSAWNKGYATESAKACLEYGFGALGLKTIIGRAARANPASIQVLKKVGMSYWKDDACGSIEDAVYYRITTEE